MKEILSHVVIQMDDTDTVEFSQSESAYDYRIMIRSGTTFPCVSLLMNEKMVVKLRDALKDFRAVEEDKLEARIQGGE